MGITRLAFNPFHDQLALTCSTDTTVKLWNLADVSSAAHNPAMAPRPPEGPIVCLSDHEDSVYGAAWSSCSPWVFASLSYNGKVLAHLVSDEVKYSILLSRKGSA
eukprot:NODE_8204_length_420_cov_27.345013_g7336_i0.p3 GENE.NODE_8204_length_420_cov_27.345013_g7336_i0~~NODE_8204_length_420_cov_27.345013_g7336_i0.p3  ORF type:complete len:113 (+),score=39.10 NODE_8204_length_420_cov_27.345013_g7336_i0:27-341(+)